MNYKKIIRYFKKVIKLPIRVVTDTLYDYRASYYLKRQSNIDRNHIKVGFIVQMTEVWDKEVDIYNEMKTRKNVDTFLLVVPPFDFANKKNTFSYENNYFINNYSEAIKVINSNGSIIDINSMKLDYVFYQRPYDHYLPKGIRSSEVIKNSRCCYIPYGYSGSDVFNAGNTNLSFFRNISYIFLESDYMKKVFELKFKKRPMRKYQHIESLGYPCLSQFFEMKQPSEIRNILWTPRWSYDQRIGGSHFFEYKDIIMKIKSDDPDINMVFRPHPLMFEQFINQGLMDDNEVSIYKDQLKSYDIEYDSDSIISCAIQKADLLITDYSSIIINFFLTGKPIIYCKAEYELNDDYLQLAEGMYIVDNEKQLINYTKMLINGDDPLKEKRNMIVNEYRKKHLGSEKRIVDYLLKLYD